MTNDIEASYFYLGLASLLAALILHQFVRWYLNSKDASSTYPPMAPTGMWETVKKISGDDFPWFLLETAKTLNTRNFRLALPIPGASMVVAVGEPALARDILNDKDTIKPEAMYGSFTDATAGIPNLFSTNGPFWHARRKGIAPAFAANQVQRMNNVALENVDEWIEQTLEPLAAAGKGFNVGDEMINLLLTSISQTAFEYSLSEEDIEVFKCELSLVLREFAFKTTTNPLRKVFGVLLKERRRAHVAAKRLHELALKIVQAYRKLDNPVKGTLIDLIMNNPCYEDDNQRAADVQALLIGGHDTTAYSIAWVLKELAMKSSLQEQLRQDLKQDGGMLKTYIREGLRLHPVGAGGSVRQTGRDFTTSDGKLIPKGAFAFMSFILPLRDPSIFGKTVDEYQPDRWDNATDLMNKAFLPYSMGKQNCAGQSLANAELQSIVSRIVSQFELTIEDPGTTAFFLTLKPVNCILKATSLKES